MGNSKTNEDLEQLVDRLNCEFEALLESSKDGIHITDGQGVTLWFNKSCERIDNVKREDIIGKNMSELVRLGIYSESVALKAIEKEKTFSVLQMVNGKEIMATATPYFKEGSIFRVIVNARDVTELNQIKRTLDKIKNENKVYKEILDNMNLLKDKGVIANSMSMRDTIELSLRVSKVDSTAIL